VSGDDGIDRWKTVAAHTAIEMVEDGMIVGLGRSTASFALDMLGQLERTSRHISIDRDAGSAFCRRHHITRLALFGCALQGDFGPDSDVAVLVEFQADHVPGFNFVSTSSHGRAAFASSSKVSSRFRMMRSTSGVAGRSLSSASAAAGPVG